MTERATATRPRGLVIRPARKGEEERLADGFMASFAIPNADRARFVAYFRDNPHLRLDDVLVGEIGGVLAGQVGILRLQMSLAGRDVAMGGLAAVGTAPEFRQRGVVAAMIRASLSKLAARGDAFSFLYPFQESFYAKHGWARVEIMERIETAPRFLPRSPLATQVRRLDPQRDVPAMRKAYDRWRAGRTGPLVRSDFWWNVRMLGRVPNGVVFAEPRTGEVTGYLLYATSGKPDHVAHSLAVKEIVAVTPNAHRGLLGFLATLGDQYTHVAIPGPRGSVPLVNADDARAEALADYGLLHRAGDLGAGASARIVDVGRALALHPSAAKVKGSLGLDLDDPVIAKQRASFDVTFAGGKTSFKRGKNERARLRLGVGDLARIYFRAASARSMIDHGRIEGHGEAAALLDEALAGPDTYLMPLNGF